MSISVKVGNLIRCVLKCSDVFVVHKMFRNSSIFSWFWVIFFWCNTAGELVRKGLSHCHSFCCFAFPFGSISSCRNWKDWKSKSGLKWNFYLTWTLISEDFKAFMETGCYTTAQEYLCHQKQKLLFSLREISLIMVIVESSDSSIIIEVPNRKILFVRLPFYTDSTCKWELIFHTIMEKWQPDSF